MARVIFPRRAAIYRSGSARRRDQLPLRKGCHRRRTCLAGGCLAHRLLLVLYWAAMSVLPVATKADANASASPADRRSKFQRYNGKCNLRL